MNNLKKHFFIIAISFFSAHLCQAQPSWEKLFSKKSTDGFRSVIEVPSGGYLAAGYTADSTVNDTDAFVVRMTTAGDTLWTRNINGTNNRKELFYKVINTSDGGYAFCGYSTNNAAGNDDAYILKMDGGGSVEWFTYWGGSGKDRAQDIKQTPDGGFIVTGYTTSPPASYYDAFLLKLNSTGDTLWSRLYGGTGYEDANSIVLLPDNGFLMGGQGSNGPNGLDYFLIRVNPIGDTLWTKRFGSTSTDNIEQIIRLSDGSFVFTGGTDAPGLGGNDGILAKTDSGGIVLWSKIYGGNSQDDFHQVVQTADNGFILCGTTRSSGPFDPNLWLVKTNADGDSLWTQTFGVDNNDHGYGVIESSDGGFVVVGYTSSFGFNGEEAYIAKLGPAGELGNFLTYSTVFSLLQPTPHTCTNSQFMARVMVRNFGRDTLPNVPVTIQVTGPINQTISNTYIGNVYPGDLDTLVFPTLLDLSIPGVYTFHCTSTIANDVIPANNTLTATVTVHPLPIVNLGPDTIDFSQGQTLTLDAGSGFLSYLWNTGATTRTLDVTATGLFHVLVTDSNNCQASDTIFANELVGMDEISRQLGINIYPNPTSGKLNLSIEKSSSVREIRILNTLGNILYTKSGNFHTSFMETLDFSDRAKGIYFLQILTEREFVTQRVILQ